MNQYYNVQLTDTAINSLAICQNYKAKQLGGDFVAAKAAIAALATSAQNDLASRPLSFPLCMTAVEYGMDNVRERISKDGYRTLFTLDEGTNTVYITLVLHQKQNIVQALYTHCIIR
ncbi:type II toxin-antitoxin system RelE/ParE family toxin [Aeromonas veronii]|uniref:type II toxin-antitoxin system RelE/ParE family toxin n=1 Tax=Aeromonas veronii TaxID=654 RepID=UPI00207D1AB4|nr:type II toxin-antitoxin system RelE/ParE family toxin [Aeromonas veronii]MCO4171321.1 type II toxin-antitoxin system RelE/ParE family toxin [Aeromonas veronii]